MDDVLSGLSWGVLALVTAWLFANALLNAWKWGGHRPNLVVLAAYRVLTPVFWYLCATWIALGAAKNWGDWADVAIAVSLRGLACLLYWMHWRTRYRDDDDDQRKRLTDRVKQIVERVGDRLRVVVPEPVPAGA